MSKFRLSFVTNSSSSSYVLAFRNPSVDLITEEELNKLNPTVKKIVESALNAYKNILKEAETVGNNQETLDEYFMSVYGWRNCTLDEILKDDNYLKEKYDEYLNFINQGFVINSWIIDYSDDESMGNLLKNICDEQNIIMLECD